MITIEVFQGRDGLAALSETWAELYRRIPRPRFFHSHGWFEAYLRHLEPEPDSVFFFLFREETGPIAVLPMKYRVQRWLGLKLRELTLLDHSHVQLNDFVNLPHVNADALIGAWLGALRNVHRTPWDVISFRRVMEESCLAGLRKGGAAREILLEAACDYIDCASSYEELSRAYSRNFRTNLNKARNRLAKEPGVRFLTLAQRDELERYFPDFLKLEASGWKGAAGTGTAIMLHADFTGFYRSLIEQFAPSGRMRINCLEIQGQPAAAQFCLLDADTIYLQKIGYDERWSKLSPGNLLLEHVIKQGTDDKAYRYVNLVTDASWHRDWHPSQYKVFNVFLFNTTPVGLLFGLHRALKRWLRPLYRRLTAAQTAARRDQPSAS